jgi:hypothetical protein
MTSVAQPRASQHERGLHGISLSGRALCHVFCAQAPGGRTRPGWRTAGSLRWPCCTSASGCGQSLPLCSVRQCLIQHQHAWASKAWWAA